MSEKDNMKRKIGQMQFTPNEQLQKRLDEKVFAKWQQYEQHLQGESGSDIGSNAMDTEKNKSNKRFVKYVVRGAAAILLIGSIIFITMPNLSKVREDVQYCQSLSSTSFNSTPLDGYFDESLPELNKAMPKFICVRPSCVFRPPFEIAN